jgi:hypothetical protein
MDETTKQGPESHQPGFNWHISNEELLSMSEGQRATYLNEKTSRLYEAITAISKAEGAAVSREDIEIILSPEELEDRHQGLDDRADR